MSQGSKRMVVSRSIGLLQGKISVPRQNENNLTHREMVQVLGTGPEYCNAKVINHFPQEAHIFQGTSIVKNQRTALSETGDEEIPHHPPPVETNSSPRDQ